VSLRTLPKTYLIHSTDDQTDGSIESSVAPGPVGIPRTTPRDNQFQLGTSRATPPNFFDPQTNSTRPVDPNFTNDALRNAPTLLPGIVLERNPAALGNPRDINVPSRRHNSALTSGDSTMTSPERGGVVPSTPTDATMTSPGRTRYPPQTPGDTQMTSPARGREVPSTPADATMTSPVKSRDEERAEHNAREAAARQQQMEEREHEQRKADAARQHEEMARDALGNFDSDEAEDNMDTDPTSKSPTDTNMDTDANNTSPTDTNMDAAPTGEASAGSATDMSVASFSNLVVGSASEIAHLRTLLWNEDGKRDDLSRGNNYMPADDYNEEPIWR
jgi:hypothetical protein